MVCSRYLAVARRARRMSALSVSLLVVGSGCHYRPPKPRAPTTEPVSALRPTVPLADELRTMLSALADDSMEGRGTGLPGSARAARYIAEELHDARLVAVGDSGYFQRVPMAFALRTGGQRRPVLLPSLADRDTVDASRRAPGVNVIGMLRGSDPELRDEVVVVAAHYDHLGIGRPVNGDSIYNGADDDGSGTVGVIAVARALANGPRPKRTTVFLLTTGEEVGLTGTRWYMSHPVYPLARTVAELEIEMIGRPDSLVGGVGKSWLTGFERSTIGETLRASGVAVAPDPRPAQRFFERSDNIAFARQGIPAHTLSTFNLHTDYHAPSDDVNRVDFDHMARVVETAIRAVRLIADGPAPQWKPGGQPAPRSNR
jgi:hypothetical protein